MMSCSLLLCWLCLLCPAVSAVAESAPSSASQQHITVSATGRCAVENFTAQQAQRLALRQARALAIEKAAGVNVTSSSLVTNGRLAEDFIKTFSTGRIIEETLHWMPVNQYQNDPARPPIIEYSVELHAVVAIPHKRSTYSGLKAHLNQNTFHARMEEMTISVSTRTDSKIAIFNIMADDTVTMLYPAAIQEECLLNAHSSMTFPKQEDGSLLVAPLPGNKRDTEAILVAALPQKSPIHWNDVFTPDEQLSLTDFSIRYAAIIEHGGEVILPYEVFE
ncbi:MAG: DUF4384 domain-containing protein [Desulfovibrionales bacterium]|nr:DUF4384 domain-containing protein [Desulfovibrionales bacterium]